jgi:PhzF family phenazine biosynthesis protein
MPFDLYQIDAFTDCLFEGNPACVVPLDHWLEDDILLKIAHENAVAETAFFIINEDKILLRWFTPEIEMDLCGHAMLATAHVLKTILNYGRDNMIFDTASGDLIVTVQNDIYTMDLPAREPLPSELPDSIRKALSKQPREVLRSRDFVLVYNNEQDIREISIDRQYFDRINLDPGGVIITSKGDHSDFVSRFFTPQASILEDPVTGSAHCSLIPYWSKRLNKKELLAYQLSDRGGKLICVDQGNRILLSGQAKTYLKGQILLE